MELPVTTPGDVPVDPDAQGRQQQQQQEANRYPNDPANVFIGLNNGGM